MRWASVISAITRNDPPDNAQMVTSNSNVRLSGPSHGVQPNSSALKEVSLRCWQLLCGADPLHAMVANQIDPGPGPGPGHQGGESGNEIQWFEEELRGAVGVGVFEGVAQFTFIGYRRLHSLRSRHGRQ